MGSHQNVGDILLARAKATPDALAFSYPQPEELWRTVTWKQFADDVREVSMGLRALGLKNEERVAIVSGTRYEWVLTDIGILCGGGATTTVYPSGTAAEAVYILNDSEAAYVIAENNDQVAKLTAARAELKYVRKVIIIEGAGSADGWVIPLTELMRLGESAKQEEWEAIIRTVKSTDIATLMYTSGTTGTPKGVVLPHSCWIYEGKAVEETRILSERDVHYLWLPLAHVFGKVLEVVGMQVGLHTAIDGRPEKLLENLGRVRPTVVAAVPRVFDKVHTKVVEGAREAGGAKWAIFQWALGVGKRGAALRAEGKAPGLALAAQLALADKLVFSKLKARFGGRLKWFVSGSAPLSMEVGSFFDAMGITILEGYGLTESSAATFINRPGNNRLGTVGQPVPGTEVRIAPDGEILVRGPGVMREYYKLPQATADTIKDGWLYTGDIGVLDADNRLQITDRKKELIKTSGGKYVSPQAIEARFKALCPYAAQPVVHGNNRPAIVMLIALEPETLLPWAKKNNITGTFAEIARRKETRDLIAPYVEELNKTLAKHEAIKHFAIIDREVNTASGDLTPSMKLKRKPLEDRYRDVLDAFYAKDLGREI